MNSMDYGAIAVTETFGMDLLVWTVAGIFLNRVVLANVRGAAGEEEPSGFRRSFFLAVAGCVVLLIAALSVLEPLLGVSPERLSECIVNPAMLTLLLLGPATLFSTQALVFQGFHKLVFEKRKTLGLAALVCSSVLSVLVLSRARENLVPLMCENPRPGFYKANDGY